MEIVPTSLGTVKILTVKIPMHACIPPNYYFKQNNNECETTLSIANCEFSHNYRSKFDARMQFLISFFKRKHSHSNEYICVMYTAQCTYVTLYSIIILTIRASFTKKVKGYDKLIIGQLI